MSARGGRLHRLQRVRSVRLSDKTPKLGATTKISYRGSQRNSYATWDVSPYIGVWTISQLYSMTILFKKKKKSLYLECNLEKAAHENVTYFGPFITLLIDHRIAQHIPCSLKTSPWLLEGSNQHRRRLWGQKSFVSLQEKKMAVYCL